MKFAQALEIIGAERPLVRDRLQDLPWERLVSDLRPFLESERDLALFTRENLLRVLR